MAITITPLGLAGALKVISDADMDGTAEKHSNDGSARVYSIDIDNTANAAVTYGKFYNDAVPTVGTTAPHMILMLPASVRRQFVFTTGVNFDTSLSWAAVTGAGTAGTTGPTSDVVANLVVA